MKKHGLLVWLVSFQFLTLSAWAGQTGAKSEVGASSFKASTHQIKEPGVGMPSASEIFVTVKTDGHLSGARDKAMEEVRFQARHKGLVYEICGTEEEQLGLGYRVKISYRLSPKTVEVAMPEEVWWKNLLQKIQNYLPYLKKALLEIEVWVNSSLAKKQTITPEAVP